MIITLKGADFSASNIGTLSSWRISRSLGTGATYEGVTSVDKGAAFSATVTLAEGYEVGTAGVTITMGGTVLSGAHSISGNVITITIASVTGNVLIKVPTINTAGGEEEEPDAPTVTNYTFTINPTPSNATVILTASGYSQSGNSIVVPNGTNVTWQVSASGYTTQSGNKVVTSNYTHNVVLAATSTETGDIINLGTLKNDTWIRFENGEEVSLTKWTATDFIAIPSNATGVIIPKVTAYSSGANKTTPIAWYDTNKTHISSYDVGENNTTWAKQNVSMTKPANAAYVRFSYANNPAPYTDVDTGEQYTTPSIEPKWTV